MKKVITLCLALSLLVCFVASPVLAANGAVKVPLKNPHGGEKGWAIVNTNANGMLNVQVHLQDIIRTDGSFKVRVRFFDIHSNVITEGILTTNVQGNGNLHGKIRIPRRLLNHDYITVGVAVGPPPPPTNWRFRTGLFSVPVK